MEATIGLLRDVIVIGYMFILRIGVPLLIVLMIGWWLRRMLEEKEEQPATLPAEEPSHPQTARERVT